MHINDTIRRFGYPDTLLADFDHWVVLLRPAQPTLGSLILAAKGDATAFGDLPDLKAAVALDPGQRAGLVRRLSKTLREIGKIDWI